MTTEVTAMTFRNAPTMTLADFARLLDIYGADRTRWPLAVRASAATRLAADTKARVLLAEAEALDTLLLRAPEPEGADVSALADRIIAAALRAPRLVASSGPAAPAVAAPRSALRAPDRAPQRAAALLAASMMIGIFVGQSQWGANAVPFVEQLTGITLQSSTERTLLAEFHVEAIDDDRAFD